MQKPARSMDEPLILAARRRVAAGGGPGAQVVTPLRKAVGEQPCIRLNAREK